MSCVLRAFGSEFDVDAFLEVSTLPIDSTWRKGEQRFPGSSRNTQLNASSGIRVVASEADFADLGEQISDTVQFLREHLDEVKRLTSFGGVEGAVLDFGVEIQPPGWASFTFPVELLRLASQCRVQLSVSVYPHDPEDEGEAAVGQVPH